jgi:hypothetical protein
LSELIQRITIRDA